MSKQEFNFELPKKIERYLAALSKFYAQNGKRQFQEIIVNAQIRIHERWTEDSDNWNGNTYGHALYLIIPEQLFLSYVEKKSDIQDQITADLNKLHNVHSEFIARAFLEMEDAANQEWRNESGLLIDGKRQAPPDATKRIWGDASFRLFLSHKTEVKKETTTVKDGLRLFGISCFVAHNDIHPTKAWQEEIENALASMDGFVALMTEGFHDSVWTDQEVGYAVARGVPIIPVRLGKDPYGFIGKFQALSSTWPAVVVDLMKILIKNGQALNAYINALHNCPSWNAGNVLAEILPSIEKLSSSQIDALIATYNETSELRGSFGFNGTKPYSYGLGLTPHLNRLGNRQFEGPSLSTDWLIKPIT
ncbi:toll/interleukin-1 receptor domain-containing protein [Nitrosospira sp. Nsp1]|uniref:toll/interleukin-1 receptor domain-containing protein n=1 Tax=Nitrosospira sp. Nsp1 TaxID=136547 RepID=UPI00088DF1C6|nr:toll/interleukin-1 receptor domain-containing protein [Nitrosospira sp. Nsp1]SCX50290.1 TIR domain-containing protein [Nitrosospira sp. Nsp1]